MYKDISVTPAAASGDLCRLLSRRLPLFTYISLHIISQRPHWPSRLDPLWVFELMSVPVCHSTAMLWWQRYSYFRVPLGSGRCKWCCVFVCIFRTALTPSSVVGKKNLSVNEWCPRVEWSGAELEAPHTNFGMLIMPTITCHECIKQVAFIRHKWAIICFLCWVCWIRGNNQRVLSEEKKKKLADYCCKWQKKLTVKLSGVLACTQCDGDKVIPSIPSFSQILLYRKGDFILRK